MVSRPSTIPRKPGIHINKTIIRDDTSWDEGIALGGGVGVVIGRTRLLWEFMPYDGDANQINLGLQL